MPKTRWCRELERQWPQWSLTEEQVRRALSICAVALPAEPMALGRGGPDPEVGKLGHLGRMRAGGVGPGAWGRPP